MPSVSLIASDFVPTSSFAGGESPTLIRAANIKLKAALDRARIEAYPGHLDIGENYDLSAETLTGTITWSTATNVVVGAGTKFTTELHIDSFIQAADTGGEVFVVNEIIDDTHFINERPPTSSMAVGKQARYLYTMCENNRQRAVQRRGNSITVDKQDIYFAGDGQVFLNGVATGFCATRAPKRLQRELNGTYTEMPVGFPTPPIQPTIQADTGGAKGMQAGKYSFLFSWYNSKTQGFSNPCDVCKTDALTSADLTIAAGGRIAVGFKPTLQRLDFVDGDVTIATGNIHHVAHGLLTGESVKIHDLSGAWPLATGGLLLNTIAYYVIKIDADNFKLARTSYLALAGTPIVYSSAAGTGTHSLYICPANADGFIVWGSQSGGGVTAVNQSNFSQGAWLQAQIVMLTDLIGPLDAAEVEYLDAELGAVASGDNFAPPDCEFITDFANTVQYISCLGTANTTNPLGTSPGNYVMPTKATNQEGVPPDWRVSVGDTITGFANGVGRLFTLTPTGVPFVTPTGNTELARLLPTGLDLPFTSRPFWTKGANSPTNLLVVQGDLFVYTGQTLMRSPSTADENNVVPYQIGLPVTDLTDSFFDGYTHLLHDPFYQEVCIVSAATKRNNAGFWISEILPYSLQKNQWQPIITVSSDTRDMIVSGGATVNNRLDFLAGGRAPSSAFSIGTFRYGAPSGLPIDCYFCYQPEDSGSETRAKQIRSVRATGQTYTPQIQVHGAKKGGSISIDDIENGTNPIATINIPPSTGLQLQFQTNYLVNNLGLWALRFSDTYPGTGPILRLDELEAEIGVHGVAN
jgi:hypothetical protein